MRELTDAISVRRKHLDDLLSNLQSMGGGGGAGAAAGGSGGGGASASATPSRMAAHAGHVDMASPRMGTGGGGGGSGRESAGGPPAINQEQLREIFEFYCNFGRTAIMTYQDSLDSFMFMKFARECPDLMDRRLNATGACGGGGRAPRLPSPCAPALATSHHHPSRAQRST